MTDILNPKGKSWHEEAGSTYHALGAQIADGTALAYQLNERERELAEVREELAEAQAAKSQAEDAQQIAEEDKAAAEERTQAEADRADGAEAKLRAVLVELVVEPATGVLHGISDGVDVNDPPHEDMEAIADSLADELGKGLGVDELTESAERQLQGWAEETR